jgi:hypothetical protein
MTQKTLEEIYRTTTMNIPPRTANVGCIRKCLANKWKNLKFGFILQ